MTRSPAEVFRDWLDSLRQRTLARVALAWDTFDPTDVESSVLAIGNLYGWEITLAQVAAVSETTVYLSTLVSEVVLPTTTHFAALGTWGDGQSLRSLGQAAVTVYLRQLAEIEQGRGFFSDDDERTQAVEATQVFLNRVAATEPHRVGNSFVAEVARHNPHFTGRTRLVLGPNACDICRQAAGTEAIPPLHPFCNCTVEPEVQELRYEGELPIRTDSDYMTEAQARQAEKDVDRWVRNALEPIRSDIVARIGRMDIASTEVPGVAGFYHPEWTRFSAWVNGYHYRGPTIRNYMRIDDWMLNPRYRDAWAKDLKMMTTPDRYGIRWWVQSRPGTTMTEQTVTHELGHFLDFQLTSQQHANILDAFLEAANEHYTYDPRLTPQANMGRVLSYYGGTNDRELVAEAWAEYMLSPNPRPPARALGDLLVRYLGG